MTTGREIPVEERLQALLDHLGIERAHFAGRTVGELERLCLARSEAVSSLTLVGAGIGGPGGLTGTEALRPHAERVLAFLPHSPSPPQERLREAVSDLSGARLVRFPEGYDALLWADVAADLTDEMGSSMLESIGAAEQSHPASHRALSPGGGEVAGVTYKIQGEGPPLVLFPLGLAPSQWEPLVPSLGKQLTTITLGGAHLGSVAGLERRAQSEGYRRVVRTMLAEAELQAGERVLEVGCGTGALVRDLARVTGGENPIIALDHSPYLLREAAAIARAEGLDSEIDFQEGDAQALPFEARAFDVTFSSTVMEEVDADRMMAELVRVTRLGGRVAVAVRSTDLPHVFNVDVPADVQRKLEAPRVGAGAAAGGCADGSLYERFARSDLTDIRMLPSWALSSPPEDSWVQGSMQVLTADEGETFQTALRAGIDAGTAFGGNPFHVAVGTKP